MKRTILTLSTLVCAVLVYAAPTVYPVGTTIYDPARAWNGYTVLVTVDADGAVLIDMNGNTLKKWTAYSSSAGGPARILPGGFVMSGEGRGAGQEFVKLTKRDWNDNIVWEFDRTERMPDGTWSARQHHDWQLPALPGGYYSPQVPAELGHDKTLILAHTNVINPSISERQIQDDLLVEIDADGKILWQWKVSDHVDELGFSPEARAAIREAAGKSRANFDWFHTNAAAYVGPNRWFEAGDQRFHPDNVIISSRQANIIAIVARDGSVAWRLGPDYSESPAMLEIGQILGQHNPHIIPKGLPGAGDLLVFDNGGAAGYGYGNPTAPDGYSSMARDHSRVLEINPQTLEVVWSYAMPGQEAFRFYSSYISGAQRLENGNTLITEGADGRLFEVTAEGDIVWEYMNPFFEDRGEYLTNRVYRAYRLPYDWVPQLTRPQERAVVPPPRGQYRLPAQ